MVSAYNIVQIKIDIIVCQENNDPPLLLSTGKQESEYRKQEVEN